MMMPLSLLCGLDPVLSQRSWAFELEMPRFLPVIVSSNSPAAAKAQRTPPSKPAMRLPSGRASLHVSGCHTLSYWIEQFVSIGLQLAKLKILLDWGYQAADLEDECWTFVFKASRADERCWQASQSYAGLLAYDLHLVRLSADWASSTDDAADSASLAA